MKSSSSSSLSPAPYSSSPMPTGSPMPATASSSASASSSSLVKYCGRAVIVSVKDPDYRSVVQRLLTLTQDLQQNGSYRTDADWNVFFGDLSAFTNHIINPDVQLQRFQVDLITDSLLPYITKLKGRFYTDKARVRQLSDIMHALSRADQVHPAFTLLMLEQIGQEIRGNQYFWKSELLSILDNALAKQWRPILYDMKALLYDVAGKLIGFGMIGIIGWPLVLAGPILMNAEKLLKVVKEWETQHRISPQSIFEVVKIVVLMFALLQIMSIVRMYQSLGILSIVLGVAAFVVTLQDSFLKQISPMFAKHAVVYDRYVHILQSLDYNEAIGMWKKVVTSTPISENIGAPTAHPQVEELPEVVQEVKVKLDLDSPEKISPSEQLRTNEQKNVVDVGALSPIAPLPEDTVVSSIEPEGEINEDSDYVMLDNEVDQSFEQQAEDSALSNTGIRQRKSGKTSLTDSNS